MRQIIKPITFLLDLGTGTTKIQTSTAEFPSHFSTLTAHPLLNLNSNEQIDYLFDNDIKEYKGILYIDSLISPYVIKMPQPFIEFLIMIFSHFEEPTEDANLVLGVPITWSSDTISKVKTIIFQNFNFHSIYCAPGELFSLYYYNVENCTLLDAGFETTRIIQFHEKKPVSNRVLSTRLAGVATSNYLCDLLRSKYPKIIYKHFARYLEQIKDTKCFLAKDFEGDLGKEEILAEITEEIKIIEFKESLTIGLEKILVPEILFRPFLANTQEIGIDRIFTQSLQETHPSLRRVLYKDVLIIGGTSKFKNFKERFTSQFQKIPLLAQTEIHHDPNIADLIPWLGMQKFVERGFYGDLAVTQTNFFANL